LFHRFESADHRLDPSAYLFIFLQECGSLGRQDVLTLFERAVLVLQLVAYVNQRIDAFFEALQFVFESRGYVIGHSRNIVTPNRRINRLSETGAAAVVSGKHPWDHKGLAELKRLASEWKKRLIMTRWTMP